MHWILNIAIQLNDEIPLQKSYLNQKKTSKSPKLIIDICAKSETNFRFCWNVACAVANRKSIELRWEIILTENKT